MAMSISNGGIGLAFGSSPGSGSSDFTPLTGTINFTKANNAKILAAMTATKANTADTIIAWMGDSTVAGQNSTGAGNTNSATNNATKQASDLLQAAGIPSSCDGWWGSVDGSSPTWANFLAANPKFTSTGTGWDFQFFCVGGEAAKNSTDTTSTFTYTTDDTCNKMDVYYLGVSGSGDFVYSVDGGSESAAVHTSQASRSMYKVTLDLGTSAAHAVKFRCSVNTVWIIGVHFYDTNTRRVIIQNQGAGGWKVSDWVVTTNGESPGNQYFNTGAHLAIAEAGLVNSRNSVSAATAQPDLQTIITNYQANNTTVWLFNPEPFDSDTVRSAPYQAMLTTLAGSTITYTDTMTPTYTTVTPWTAAGFGDGSVHPLGLGYGYIAGREAAKLQAVWAAA